MARIVALAMLLAQPAAAVLRGTQQPLLMDGGEMGGEMVVEVPVVEVVMVDDGADNATQLRQSPLSPEQKLHMDCEKEMFLMMMNQTRLERSQKCEQSGGHVNRSILALQHGDTKAASKSVVQTFVDCASLSTACAEAMAPGLVQKMRLSGVTVDHQCELAAKNLDDGTHKPATNATAVTAACEKNTTRKLIGQLQHDDLEAAMLEAQQGLEFCNGVSGPCDFQLAPMLVTQIMEEHEAQEEAHALHALFDGLRAAQQFKAKMSAKDSAKNSTQGHKAPLSLVSLATSARLASRSHIMKF